MAKETKIWIVEFRFPYEIKDEPDPEKAAKLAQQMFNDQHGFTPHLWNCRVIEFTNAERAFGAQKEYFFSPTGMTMKEINKNILPHEERAKNEQSEG